MTLKPDDTLLHGRYRIQRLLGRGGFGFVYQAQDTLLSDEVAIKELIPALVGDDVMLKRFLAEAKATMRLTHEHIVRTHNVFQEGDNYYIVMECMSGGSLEDRLREHGPLPVDDVVRIAAEVCEGLNYAHQHGIVHCDLKPGNILFTAGDARSGIGLAKVADFGIAHVSDQMLSRSWMTPAGFAAGTLAYMSPEQTDGLRDDPRVDVYAMGAVLYRMLTGRTYLDFDQRETPRAQAENVNRICQEKPSPPSTYHRCIPGWLDEVVLKALSKHPDERYSSAAKLRATLERQGAAILALPPAEADGAPIRPRQHRAGRPVWFWLAVGGAGVMLVAVVIGLVLFSGAGEGPGQPVTSERTQIAEAPATAIADATDTPRPPTSTPRPTGTPQPTDTLRPTTRETVALTPTRTEVLPTSMPRPTSTQVPPTSTPRPTSTQVLPTRTPSPPTATPTSQPAVAAVRPGPTQPSDPSVATLEVFRVYIQNWTGDCYAHAGWIAPSENMGKIGDERLEVFAEDGAFLDYILPSSRSMYWQNTQLQFALVDLAPGRYSIKITWHDSDYGLVSNVPTVPSTSNTLVLVKTADDCWSE